MQRRSLCTAVPLSMFLLAGAFLLTPAMAEERDSDIAGELIVGKPYSYIIYYNESSDDSIVWYFATQSQAGKKILAVCTAGKDCFVDAMTQVVSEAPKNVPEGTSGTAQIISVSRVARQPFAASR